MRGKLIAVFGVVLPALGVAPLTPAQPDVFDPAASSERQRQLVEQIEDEQGRAGNLSEGLIEPLRNLAFLYRETEDHGLAVAAIGRARDVVRVNYGLHSFEQASLLRQAIETEEARGNVEAAWNLEQELLTLARRHRDDVRSAPILRDIAAKRMDVLRRYMAGPVPPQVVLGCYYHGANVVMRKCASGSKSFAARSILSEAWGLYTDAIAVIRDNEGSASEEIRELEMALVRANYVFGDLLIAPARYTLGKHRLRRLLDHDIEIGAPRLRQVSSLLQLADWDLMYAHHSLAHRAYEQAYAQMAAAGEAESSIEQFFFPELPVVLPTFLANPLHSAATPESTGHIDVAFDITKYGRGTRIDILDTTVNATRTARRDLRRLILGSSFRPRTTNGEFRSASRVVVRYHLTE